MMNISGEINCAVIAPYRFPVGLAPTNRILAYSKGLIENGASVDVFIPFPTEKPESLSIYRDKGVYQNVSYCYTTGRYSSRYKIFRVLSNKTRYRFINGYLSTFRRIFKENKKKKYNCIIISTDQIFALKIYSLLAKRIGIPSIFIFDEFPIPIRHKLKDRIPKWKERLFKIVLKDIDAYISISEELKRYFNNFSPKRTFILPVIVDVSRFNNNYDKLSNIADEEYLCYMGNMELAKDDVDNIIKAFSLISEKYSSLKLYLFGSPSVKTEKYLNNLILSLKLTDRVLLKGRVKSEEVPYILTKAHILVSSQPDTVRASGGFPTKLGEYLASGVPSLLTNVGENGKYVKEDVHVFFSEPGNPQKYADKIIYIMDNYDEALKVAEKGKKYLLDNYSHSIMGYKLLNFIKSL